MIVGLLRLRFRLTIRLGLRRRCRRRRRLRLRPRLEIRPVGYGTESLSTITFYGEREREGGERSKPPTDR